MSESKIITGALAEAFISLRERSEKCAANNVAIKTSPEAVELLAELKLVREREKEIHDRLRQMADPCISESMSIADDMDELWDGIASEYGISRDDRWFIGLDDGQVVISRDCEDEQNGEPAVEEQAESQQLH